MQNPLQPRPAASRFATTRWTLLRALRAPSTESRRVALEKLCELYWKPIHAFIRRTAPSVADADDLTQQFFVTVIERDVFEKADPKLGRFRTFLLTAVRRFVASQWRRKKAKKRGGDRKQLSLVSEENAVGTGYEPTDATTPEMAFEYQWALTVVDATIASLRESAIQHGKLERYEKLRPFLDGTSSRTYTDLATELDMTAGALRKEVERMRKTYGKLLRQHVADTMTEPTSAAVDEELKHLIEALKQH